MAVKMSEVIATTPPGAFKSPLERVSWLINNLPVEFFRSKPFPGPVWVSLEDFRSIIEDLRTWCAENDRPFLYGETSIGLTGPLLKGVVIAATLPQS